MAGARVPDALPDAPPSVVGPDGAPRFGTYRGALHHARLSELRGPYALGPVGRLLKHKKWAYGFAATPKLACLFAVVDVGYASNAFAAAVDLERRQVLFDETALGPPRPFTEVNELPQAGFEVRFSAGGATLTGRREAATTAYAFDVRAASGRHGATLRFDVAGAAPPLTVVAPVDGGRVNVTQKWAGLTTQGALTVAGQSLSLDGAVGGLDFTYGYLARRTAWRWAFGVGHVDGARAGFNCVEGFNESRDDVNENAVWLGDRLVPLGRARFTYEPADVLRPWALSTTCGRLDLRLEPFFAHQERRNLGLVQSRFLQPVGVWTGTLTLDGQKHAVQLPGVAEDQAVVW